LKPGETIHFSIYDPKTGEVDDDAGYAVAPNIAEQGVWFPVFLLFAPDTTIFREPIRLGDLLVDEIGSDRSEIEFRLQVNSDLRGSGVTVGMWSTGALWTVVRDPSGSVLYENPATQCAVTQTIWLPTLGTYRITVKIGQSGGTGPFALGVQIPPKRALPYLCGTLSGAIGPEWAAYQIVNASSVSVGQELDISPGVRLEVVSGASMKGGGLIQGNATESLPIVLARGVAPLENVKVVDVLPGGGRR
jgi:hypothetical protein